MEHQKHLWAEALGLSNDFLQNCPQEQSPLVWAHAQQEISEEDYLHWARTHYDLPSLNLDYFQSTEPLAFEESSIPGEWSIECIPIEEWQGKIFVACLEPPIQKIPHIIYLLAPYSQLEKLWTKYKNSLESSKEPLVKNSPPPSLTTPLGPPALFDVPDSPEESPIELQSPTKSSQATKSVPLKTPPAVADLDFGSLQFPTPAVNDPSTEPSLAPPPLPQESPLQVPKSPPLVNSTSAPLERSPKVIPPPPLTANKKKTEKPTVALNIAGHHQINQEDLVDVPPIEKCETLEQMILLLFKELKSSFSRQMWISKNDKGHFVPEWVFGEWKTAPNTWKTPVNISQPNIFKIAHSSQLPFHGKPAPNPINNSYMTLWNQGSYPLHMTIYPIFSTTKGCLGFYLGWDKGTSFHLETSLLSLDHSIAKIKRHPLFTAKKGAAS